MIIENSNTKESVNIIEIDFDSIKWAVDLLNDDPTSSVIERIWNFYGQEKETYKFLTGNDLPINSDYEKVFHPAIGNINLRRQSIESTHKSLNALKQDRQNRHEKWVKKVQQMYPDEVYNEECGLFESQMGVSKSNSSRIFPPL